MLPRLTPPPAHRTIERATAQPDTPRSEAAENAILAAVQQLQATLIARHETLEQRLTRVEQAQTSAATVAASRPRDRREHTPRLRATRRDSDSSISSRDNRPSSRKRVIQTVAKPFSAPLLSERPTSMPVLSTCIAPAPRPKPIPTAGSHASEYSYPFLESLRIAEPRPIAHTPTERVSEPAPQFAVIENSQDAGTLDWDAADRETLLKAASRPRFIESSGVKIRSFLADAELFLTLCNRPRSRWAYFVLSWLGSEEAEKVRRSHVVDSVADYSKFRDGLTTIFGRFEFEGAFRAQLRSLRQPGAETVTAFAARTTDLCSRAYVEFATETQLSLAVDHFIGGLADTSTRDYLLRERARRPLE
jgi:hypothetical protein